MTDVNILGWLCEEAARLIQAARACVAISGCRVMLAERLATCYSRLGGWLLLWLKKLASNACFAFSGRAALAPLGACYALAACWL